MVFGAADVVGGNTHDGALGNEARGGAQSGGANGGSWGDEALEFGAAEVRATEPVVELGAAEFVEEI